ncbi:acylphosphatase [Terrimonas rubra]|uniref:acylphosphatase n=1 Tax=Terrimonas rubra TaxID=1035890 RepID=A0ABW6A7E7_9BACT
MKTISIIVSGKVQGVYYRQSTRKQALSLHINGTVKNNADGSVSIIATGTQEQLDQLISWCKQGPPLAKVGHITVTDMPLTSYDDFSILR